MVEGEGTVPVAFRGYVSVNEQIAGTEQDRDLPFVTYHPYMHDESIKKEEGVYRVCATGSYYAYFNGEEWESKELLYQEGDDWASCYAGHLTPHPDHVPTGIARSEIHEYGRPYAPMLQSIKVFADLGREEINELGRKRDYCKVVNFPVEITEPIIVLPMGT